VFKLRDYLTKLFLFFTIFFVAVSGLSLTGMNNGFAQSSQENVLSVVKNFRLGIHDAKTRIVMDVKGPISYKYFLLANPYRLVLDMLEVDFELHPVSGVLTGGVLGYRFGLLKPGISRVVIDLSKPLLVDKHFIIKPGAKPQSRLVIDLIPTTRSKFLAHVRKSRNQKTIGLLKLKSEEQKHQTNQGFKNKFPQKKISKSKIIVLDPGHGGVDPGAIGIKGTYEKKIVLMAAKSIKKILGKSGRYNVILTRKSDRFIPLRKRVAIARRAKADLFISLHADSIKNGAVRGATVYTLSENASDREAAQLAERENKSDLIVGIDLDAESQEVTDILIDLVQRETMNQSAVFADAIVQEITKKIKTHRRPHKFAGFAVLKALDIPSILLEMGYLSNIEDETLLNTDAFQKKLGRAILLGLDRYFFEGQSFKY
jgi:N-acetylmuramoyl-L-alanine amidase